MNSPNAPKMTFDVVSVRLSAQASEARCKQAMITLDTNMAGTRKPSTQPSCCSLPCRPA